MYIYIISLHFCIQHLIRYMIKFMTNPYSRYSYGQYQAIESHMYNPLQVQSSSHKSTAIKIKSYYSNLLLKFLLSSVFRLILLILKNSININDVKILPSCLLLQCLIKSNPHRNSICSGKIRQSLFCMLSIEPLPLLPHVQHRRERKL